MEEPKQKRGRYKLCKENQDIPYATATFYEMLKKVENRAREGMTTLLSAAYPQFSNSSATTNKWRHDQELTATMALTARRPRGPSLSPLRDIGNANHANSRKDTAKNMLLSKGNESIPATPLLYPGAKITQHESMLSILYLASRPDITMATLSIVLDLIRIHLPENTSNIDHLGSLYKFKQMCLHSSRTILHHVCPKCSYLFKDGENVCPTSTSRGMCGGERWLDVGSRRQPAAFFIEMDAANQIREFFKDADFVEDITSHRTVPSDDGTMRDIYDGSLYRENLDFLREETNISLLWHTDGVAVYKSTDLQIWPVQAVINELPLKKRFSKNYIVLFGLWFGPSKPNMNNYLKPIVCTLEDMFVNGFEVDVYKQKKQCRVLALACTMDLPAMSAVKEVHQFNGSFGCGLCEHEGVQVARKHGKCRVYPYTENLCLRTHESIVEHGKEALGKGGNKAIKGVKGLSVVMLIPRCNIATHFLVDHMHGVCLGVVKRMMECWFDSVLSKAYCIKSRKSEADAKFLSIQPPSDIRRPPQTLRRCMKFKASEYMYFLLFYGLFLLKGILPNTYFLHFAMLSRGVYLLMTDSIDEDDIGEAKDLLRGWLQFLGKYYGPEQCTINAHNVGVHLVQSVRLGGPLYTHGCFGFESRCGDYSRMVTSTRYPAQQIASGITITRDFRSKVAEGPSLHPAVTKLIQHDKRNLTELGHNFNQMHRGVKTTLLSSQEIDAIQKHDASLTAVRGQKFSRLERRGIKYEGSSGKNKVHCDQYVKYIAGCQLYGRIENFLSLKDDNGIMNHVALVKPFSRFPEADLMKGISDQNLKDLKLDPGTDLLAHIVPVKISDQLHAVPIYNLENKLIFLPGDKARTWGNIIELPFNFEHN